LSWREEFESWLRRVLDEQVGVGAVFFVCAQRGLAPARARDLAEDGVQKAALRAWQTFSSADRFQDYTHFAHWFRRVAVNHARDVLRREQREERRRSKKAAQLKAEAAGPKSWIEAEDVRTLVEQLPSDDQLLLKLYYEDGLTLDELAERLLPPDGRSRNARRLEIWRRLRKLVQDLRQHLLGEEPAPAGGPAVPAPVA